jgi:RNA polymerase-binding protein DksA
MQAKSRDRLKQDLRDTRSRIVAQARHLSQALDETAAAAGEGSAAPVHLADFAPASMDADARALASERDLLAQIDAALDRLDEGTYGKCRRCGEDIEAARLEAIPYTPFCANCADQSDPTEPLGADDLQED